MRFLVLLVLLVVVAIVISRAVRGPPSSDDEVLDSLPLPTARQADTPSRHPDDDPQG